MNDRMEIAKVMMASIISNSRTPVTMTPAECASDAIHYADALLAALADGQEADPHNGGVATTGTVYCPPGVDEVGDWRRYAGREDKREIMHVASGDFSYARSAFVWEETPQGRAFWLRVYKRTASDADKARARDFARRVIEAMEADGE